MGTRPRVLGVLGALIVGALLLQVHHLDDAWSAWMPNYARYARPHWLELTDGTLPWRKPMGMHPPLWFLLAAVLGALGSSIHGLLALSMTTWVLAASAGAALLWRASGPVAAGAFLAVLGLAPFQVHYATELNNYPLLQLATALLVAVTAATWGAPTRARLLAVSAVVGFGLWSHFATAPLVLALGVCAVAGRRWRLAAATLLGVGLAAPVLLEAVRLGSDPQTFHNQSLPLAAMAPTLARVWGDKFVGLPATVSILLTLTLSAAAALRNERTRPLAFLLVCALLVALTWVGAGFTSGGAAHWQTPYWIGLSWIATALLALGIGGAAPRLRVALIVVLLPWAAAAVQWHATPADDWLAEHGDDPAGTSALSRYLDSRVDPARGDVLVYTWDGFENDTVGARDPWFGRFRARDLAPFTRDGGRLARDTSGWMGAGLLVGPGHLSEDLASVLADEIARWADEGRVTHVVQPNWSPGLGPPATEDLARRLRRSSLDVINHSAGRATLLEVRPRSR